MKRGAPKTLNLADVDGLNPVEQAACQLRQWIEAGDLPPGKKLPSERELARRLGLSRAAVRVALLDLESAGLARCAPRSGRIVTARPAASPGHVLQGTVVVLAPPGMTASIRNEGQPGWSTHLYRGVIETLFQRGAGVLLLSSQDLAARLEQLRGTPPRGIIVIDEPLGLSSREKILAGFHVGEVPVTAYGDLHAWPGCDVVTSDHEAGSYALTRWVLAQGCRHPLPCRAQIAPEPDWLERRDAGYRRAMQEAGLEPLPPLEWPRLPLLPDPQAHLHMMARLAAGCLADHLKTIPRPDALLVVSDGEITTIAAGCRVLSLDPDHDLLVAGYDNYWRDCAERQWEPTRVRVTVDKDNARIGQALAELMLDRLAGKLPHQPQQRVVAPRLVVEAD